MGEDISYASRCGRAFARRTAQCHTANISTNLNIAASLAICQPAEDTIGRRNASGRNKPSRHSGSRIELLLAEIANGSPEAESPYDDRMLKGFTDEADWNDYRRKAGAAPGRL